MQLEIHDVKIEYPEGCNIILGQTHFIKTAEDLYETIATTVPQARFGIAFTEASGPCLIRTEGNDDELVKGCITALKAIGAGHVYPAARCVSHKCSQPDQELPGSLPHLLCHVQPAPGHRCFHPPGVGYHGRDRRQSTSRGGDGRGPAGASRPVTQDWL